MSELSVIKKPVFLNMPEISDCGFVFFSPLRFNVSIKLEDHIFIRLWRQVFPGHVVDQDGAHVRSGLTVSSDFSGVTEWIFQIVFLIKIKNFYIREYVKM